MNCFRSDPKVPGKVVEEQAARRINANDITIMRINENLLNNMILCISFEGITERNQAKIL